MQISIKSNINVVFGHIKNIKKQIDFVAAKALSDIAIDVKQPIPPIIKTVTACNFDKQQLRDWTNAN